MNCIFRMFVIESNRKSFFIFFGKHFQRFECNALFANESLTFGVIFCFPHHDLLHPWYYEFAKSKVFSTCPPCQSFIVESYLSCSSLCQSASFRLHVKVQLHSAPHCDTRAQTHTMNNGGDPTIPRKHANPCLHSSLLLLLCGCDSTMVLRSQAEVHINTLTYQSLFL